MGKAVTATQSVRAEVVRAMERTPGAPASALAKQLQKDLGDERLVDFALEQIERVVVRERRRTVRQIEASAESGVAETSDDGWGVVAALLEEYRHGVIVDWTAELLASEFAVGDGTSTTWASATTQQHQARIAMLQGNVRGNLDAICRHEAAIAAIQKKSGARTLGEAVA